MGCAIVRLRAERELSSYREKLKLKTAELKYTKLLIKNGELTLTKPIYYLFSKLIF